MAEEIDDNKLIQAYQYWHDCGFDEGFEEGYDPRAANAILEGVTP